MKITRLFFSILFLYLTPSTFAQLNSQLIAGANVKVWPIQSHYTLSFSPVIGYTIASPNLMYTINIGYNNFKVSKTYEVDSSAKTVTNIGSVEVRPYFIERHFSQMELTFCLGKSVLKLKNNELCFNTGLGVNYSFLEKYYSESYPITGTGIVNKVPMIIKEDSKDFISSAQFIIGVKYLIKMSSKLQFSLGLSGNTLFYSNKPLLTKRIIPEAAIQLHYKLNY